MDSDSKSVPKAARAVAQPIVAPLTRAAIFLVVTLKPGPDNRATLRSFCGDLSGIFRAVEYRNIEAGLSCIMGIGSDAWDRLFGQPRPAELHPFREVRAGARHAVSTPEQVDAPQCGRQPTVAALRPATVSTRACLCFL
jgi:deferrochelatase/peroxidase EfeB